MLPLQAQHIDFAWGELNIITFVYFFIICFMSNHLFLILFHHRRPKITQEWNYFVPNQPNRNHCLPCGYLEWFDKYIESIKATLFATCSKTHTALDARKLLF